MTDLNRILPDHTAVSKRLEQWGGWVRVHPSNGATMPMFRGYQSKARQWDAAPHIPVEYNEQECLDVEKAVATLPADARTAIRWCYVFPWVPFSAVRRELGVTRSDLLLLLDFGRAMLSVKLKRVVK
jgi:hypothetical protein